MATEPAAKAPHAAVIDYFALALTHALIVLALVRLVGRGDLDIEDELDDRPRAVRKNGEGSGDA